jgi:hypothetical protein
MTEWWTYRLGSFLMFTSRTYGGLVERYNADLWPLQPLLLALGALALAWVWRGPTLAPGRWVWALLGVAWLWVGWAFHHQRFAAINWAAEYVGWAFGAQGLALLWLGAVRGRLGFGSEVPVARFAGAGIVAFGLFAQPLLGVALGRPWAQAESFGVMSDPTALATLGFLVLAQRPPWSLLLVPLLSCVLGGALASALQAPVAWLMPALAGAAVASAAWRRRAGSRPAGPGSA